jgi:hypothetical protein
MPDRREASPRAGPLGTQPSSDAMASTRSLVAVEKPLPPVITRDTVAVDTPLRSATS